MFCRECGNKMKEGAVFCPKCGTAVKEESEANFKKGASDFLGNMNTKFEELKKDQASSLQIEEHHGINVTRKELKELAQRKLSGKFGQWSVTLIWMFVIVIALILVAVLTGIKGSEASFFGNSFVGFIWGLIAFIAVIATLLVLILGNAVIEWCAINTLYDRKVDGKRIYYYFIRSEKNRVLLANILVGIFTFLWTLLFIIPGIIKGASYSMTNYLMERDRTLSANQAIKLSRQLMHGYKLEYLILNYSFFFWRVAMSVTNGLVFFYVGPYQAVTRMAFFDKIYDYYLEKNHEAL
ncbi:DUF975 family protein [Vagococcus intermedius]|uniref:DUF975 family protein n=1 Tax=Vagococcus intermedius TaxID=2991418 RepID=A0AAF0I9P7_9ENTE|nr:DUF975 family protein [Vagococcus intermedius]WEG73622.1 DUF975 family protein [Vagococcus intermedius]WEG75706.1 DUF975 family protein [Vagococcus intermedius]